MFRKFTAAAMSAMIVAIIVLSTCDLASRAMARGRGGGGGHRGGGGHVRRSSSRQNHVSHHRTFSQNAHQKHSFAQNKHKHSQHHHRRHRGYFGWNGGDGDFADGDFADGDVDPSEGDAAAAVLPITLLNPSEIGRPVSYTLDSGNYSVDPAGSKVHNEGTQTIVFDRGGAFGQASYTLQPGNYRFTMTDKGLDLRTVTPQVATDQVAADTVVNPK
jgi:hypothetical protein